MAVEGVAVRVITTAKKTSGLRNSAHCLRPFASECSRTKFCLKSIPRDAAELNNLLRPSRSLIIMQKASYPLHAHKLSSSGKHDKVRNTGSKPSLARSSSAIHRGFERCIVIKVYAIHYLFIASRILREPCAFAIRRLESRFFANIDQATEKCGAMRTQEIIRRFGTAF